MTSSRGQNSLYFIGKDMELLQCGAYKDTFLCMIWFWVFVLNLMFLWKGARKAFLLPVCYWDCQFFP